MHTQREHGNDRGRLTSGCGAPSATLTALSSAAATVWTAGGISSIALFRGLLLSQREWGVRGLRDPASPSPPALIPTCPLGPSNIAMAFVTAGRACVIHAQASPSRPH
jgi:hypothetical protein